MKGLLIPRHGWLLQRLCLVLIGVVGEHDSVRAVVSTLEIGSRERLLILAPHPDDDTFSLHPLDRRKI